MKDLMFGIKKTQVLTNIRYEGKLVYGQTDVCTCKVNVNKTDNSWSISGWYTDDGYMNRGYGKLTLGNTLKELYKDNGRPDRIEYIWNGSNDYVYDWMKNHFDAKQKSPAVGPEDDWDSHIYYLDVDKVLNYFEVN